MSLREAPLPRKSLPNIRAFIAALDPKVLLITRMGGVLTLAGIAVAGLTGDPAVLIVPVAMLLVPAAATSYGWYLTTRGYHPPRYAVARTPGAAGAAPRNWHPRYGPVAHAPSREQTIMDTRRPQSNGRIHHCVQLGRRQQNRTVGDRLGQASS